MMTAPSRFFTAPCVIRLATACMIFRSVAAASPRPSTFFSRSIGAEITSAKEPNASIRVLRQRLDVAARDRAEQHQLEQFVVGERLRASVPEALAQPLAMAVVMRLRSPRASPVCLAGIPAPCCHGLMMPRKRGQANRGRRIAARIRPYKAACAGPGRGREDLDALSVTPTVCSNCADSERSRVTAVQPSESTFTCGRPRLIIGSTVKNMPGREHDAFAGAPDMHDVGLVVEQPAEAVAAEVAHHAHVLRFDVGLDRGADIAGGAARLDRGDAAHHRLVGDLDQAFGAARDFADRVHAAGIAMPAVEDQGDVDIDDVAFAQWLLVRNAVADDVVDRGAGGLAVAAIHQGRGQRAVIHRDSRRPAGRSSRSACRARLRRPACRGIRPRAGRPCACLRRPRPRVT